jgi:NHL repeat-containing protein
MTRRLLACAALVAIAGCGGGGGSVPGQPAVPAQQNGQKGTAQITIRVPSSTQTTDRTRAPRYVSASTKSLVISANGSVVTVANISPTSPGCTPASGPTPLTCIVNADLTGGATTVGFSAFDQPGGLGNKLSTASMSATITPGAVNPLAVTMNGVVTHLSVDFTYPNGLGAAIAAVPITVGVLVNAQDAGGNTIIGPGGFVDGQGNPVTITLSKDANSFDLDAFSTSTITAPGTPVTIRYNGHSPLTTIACARGSVNDSNLGIVIVPGTARQISASIPNVATGTNPLQIINITGVSNPRNITVSNAKSNTVTTYFPYYAHAATPDPANGMNEASVRAVVGSSTGLSVPQGVTYDNAGIMYVAGSSMASMEGFDPHSGASHAPCPAFAGSNEAPDFSDGTLVQGFGNAPDPAGNITVACQTCAGAGNLLAAVDTFAPGAGGAMLRQITGALTLLAQPFGVAYDSAGNLYVANSGNSTITVYAPNATGNVAPIRTILAGTSGLNQPKGLATDKNDNLYVASFGSNTVLVYASGANGAAVPTRTYTGLNQPYGVAIRKATAPFASINQAPPFTDVYVTNFNDDSIYIFDPTVAGSTPAFVYKGPDTQLSGPTFITFGD